MSVLFDFVQFLLSFRNQDTTTFKNTKKKFFTSSAFKAQTKLFFKTQFCFVKKEANLYFSINVAVEFSNACKTFETTHISPSGYRCNISIQSCYILKTGDPNWSHLIGYVVLMNNQILKTNAKCMGICMET